MSLVKWDPFRDFNRLPLRFGDFFGKEFDAPVATTTWNPSVDIFENDNEVVIKAELPGLNAKDIDVKLENNVLTLKGERHFEKETKEENYYRIDREYGTFSRSFKGPKMFFASSPCPTGWRFDPAKTQHYSKPEVDCGFFL